MVSCIEDGNEHGLQFEFEAPLNSDISQNRVTAEWQLERACDEIGIKNQGDYVTLTHRLSTWARMNPSPVQPERMSIRTGLYRPQMPCT